MIRYCDDSARKGKPEDVAFCESVKSCGTHLSSFLTLSMACKCFNIVGFDTLNICANSAAVCEVSDSTAALRSSFLTLGSGFPLGSFWRSKSPLMNFENHRPTVTLLVDSSPNTLFTLRTASAVLVPQRNSYSKRYASSTSPLITVTQIFQLKNYIIMYCNINYKV